MNNLQQRLRLFINLLNISVLSFETRCGLSSGAVSKMSEKTYSRTFNRIAAAFPQLNIGWLKTGEGEMLNPEAPQSVSGNYINGSFNNSPQQAVNIGGGQTARQHQPTTANAPVVPPNIKPQPNLDVLEFIRNHADDIPRSVVSIEHAAITMWYGVEDSALYPNFRIDDLVALLEEKHDIIPGKMYVIDTYSQGMIFRILMKDGADKFLCRSVNASIYPDFTIDRSDVIRIYKVIGMFRFNNNI